MNTIYLLITEMSIIGIKIIDIILSILFDALAFRLAWKIGALGSSGKTRFVLHWSSRIGFFLCFVLIAKLYYFYIGISL